MISLLKNPIADQCEHQELESPEENPDESVLQYMGPLQDNIPKAVPKLKDVNREELAVSLFCEGQSEHEFGRMTGMQPKGKVASGRQISPSATAFFKNQQ